MCRIVRFSKSLSVDKKDDSPSRKPPRAKGTKNKRDAEQDTLVYSTDANKIILLARAAGFSDLDIMRKLLENVYGVNQRKRLLLQWANDLGKEPSEILREAARHGLIPNDRMPPKR